ncbi:MliC family protein [Mariluticola halotolerans]|uniref:MliC family protein n=1 Tax=Mariluticola halotolerans TaxID=2909283 RepID=UPI0026E445ED|nr:MliC family protein [Mariluticola halotolerans]UJQ94558.1 MliC family protein [Mariluticola halotolerans]
MRRFMFGTFAMAIIGAAPVAAAETSMQLVITLPGNAERHVVHYKCEDADEPLQVEYLNANPDYLAILPVDGVKQIFVTTIAASGVRYISGKYVWWTKGAEASLFDLTEGLDAEPLTSCLEANDIP